MIIAWMAYAAAFTAIAAGGALALERLAEIWGTPRRFVWLAALASSAAVPVALALVPRSAPPIAPMITGPAPSGAATARPKPGASPMVRRVSVSVVAPNETALSIAAVGNHYAGAVWSAVSAVLLLLMVRDVWMVRRRRARWPEIDVDGHRVLLADDVGPAVVGAAHPKIVVPAWVLGLDADARGLMLRHESEHIRAGDPVVLLLAALAVVLFPWNPALWYVVRRLRLTIEIDCDQRVLRAVNRPREYGMLLLAVGARRGVSLPLTASLAERRPLLERRILAMTSLRPSRPMLASLPFGVIAMVATAVAAQTPHPVSMAVRHATTPKVPTPVVPVVRAPVVPPVNAAPAVQHGAVTTPDAPDTAASASPVVLESVQPSTVEPTAIAGREPIPVEVLRAWIQRYHPTVMQGDTLIDVVTFVIDAADNYVNSLAEKMSRTSMRTLDVLVPGDIDRVEVVKGSAAMALYGAAAENGVVVITTKKTEAGAATPPDATPRKIRIASMPPSTTNQPLFIIDGVVQPMAPAMAPPKLDLDTNRIDTVEVMKLGAGRVGPNAISIVVVKLKAGER